MDLKNGIFNILLYIKTIILFIEMITQLYPVIKNIFNKYIFEEHNGYITD